ncbi:FliG C-terminal domain-containing protein [Candidatus Latescibacterota bacterium]
MSALPPNPSLRHLKKEAKRLLKALGQGDGSAAGRFVEHLPRFGRSTPDEVLAASVSLQEAQHVVACTYGFANWDGLLAQVESPFEQLVRLCDAEVDVLVAEADRRDLVVAIKGLDFGPVNRRHQMLLALSVRARDSILDELKTSSPSPEACLEAQDRIAETARRLGEQERIGWPPGTGLPQAGPAPEPQPEVDLPLELHLLQTPLDELSVDQVRQVVHGMADLAWDHGVAALERLLPVGASDLLDEGIRLAVDGTEPDLVMDLMETRAGTVVRNLRVRMDMIIEGMASIATGDNPRIVARKLDTWHSSLRTRESDEAEGTVESACQRLQERPASSMSPGELTSLITEMAWIAYRAYFSGAGGPSTLMQLVAAIDDEYLACAIRLVAGGSEGDPLIRELQERRDRVLEPTAQRCRLLAVGLPAIQEGKHADTLDEALDRALTKAPPLSQ